MQPDHTSETPPAAESLNDLAYSILRTAILGLRYPPGTQLSERRVAAAHELSLNPVRSAMARLVSEGILTVKPRSGYVVAPISPRNARELFEVWSITAGGLMLLALEKSTPEDRAEMVRLAERLGGFTHDNADKGIISAFELFELFARVADNDRITGFSHQLRGELGRFVLIVEQVHPLQSAIVENVRELIGCIRRVDGPAARATLESFINDLGRRAQTILARIGPETDDIGA